MKKVLSFLMAVIMMLGCFSGVIAANDSTTVELPKDTQNHWVKDYILPLLKDGIVTGYKDGTFKPDNNISRAEFSKMLADALIKNEGIKYSEKTGTFKDVSADQWFSKYIETVAEEGFVGGRGNGIFDPDALITREEITKIIALAFCKINNKTTSDYKDVDLNSFGLKDLDNMADWAPEYAKVMLSEGLIKGDDAGNYNARANARRADVVVILYRLFGYDNSTGETPDATGDTPDVTDDKQDLGFVPASIEVKDTENFKVAQFTDSHFDQTDWDTNMTDAIKNIELTASEEKPDLMVFTGDTFTMKKSNAAQILPDIFSKIDALNIPWTIVFGVGENTKKILKSDIEAAASKANCKNLIFKPYAKNDVTGNTNQVIEVYNENKELGWTIFLLDTKSSTTGVVPNQVDWYKKTTAYYQEKYKNVKSMIFSHVAVPEILETKYTGATYGILSTNVIKKGRQAGLFDAAVAAGNVKAIYAGNNHNHGFRGEISNISIGLGICSGVDSSSSDKPAIKGSRILNYTDVTTEGATEATKGFKHTIYKLERNMSERSIVKMEEEVKTYKDKPTAKFKFNEDGKFKIAQLTDVHTYGNNKAEIFSNLDKLVANEKPDLIVLTGDCFNGNGPEDVADYVKKMDEIQVPWTSVFGNHDNHNRNGSDDLMMYEFTKSKYFVGSFNELDETKTPYIDPARSEGNHVLDIMSQDGSKLAWRLFMLDNGRSWIPPELVEWYKLKVDEANKEYGEGTYSALAYAHIPVYEYQYVHPGPRKPGDNRPIDKDTLGFCWEPRRFQRDGKPTPNNEIASYGEKADSGLFQAFLDSKVMRGMFVGHDHLNNYIGRYKGIYLAFGRTADKIGYNFNGSQYLFPENNDFINEPLPTGSTIITLDEKTPGKFTMHNFLFDEGDPGVWDLSKLDAKTE